ncbi:P-loop containing nucleoside triphosphate hydrolase protein, partial [Rhodotorula sp. JG-1b]
MGTDRIQTEATGDPSRQGITPRAVADIFARLKQAQQDANGALTFTAKVSYVEIYNEDLIDLLAGDVGVRPTVQIREDKQGRIFWSGLRELKVSSAAEVMNLLAAGSALRQTGATDMNAQSSRSHAIFSLTVTQQRWSGAGPPQGEEAAGTWTNVTSKFHFVDLAGSERLKRTAAAGERAKEGISINAGLSALGNVISALGDPTKKGTHIPYRDSKLTRLLQDSLGGNARTMMIACISPAEFNLHETLSTLKYANRARNIKNRAEVNESEAGWDDLVYLQRTIVKLRAELATIKAGDLDQLSNEGDNVPAGTGDVFDASLQQRVALLTAELAKAQAEVPSQGDQPATSLVRDQFAAAVEPIVEEYERSLSALESQLALTRAALGHSEEEMRDLEHRVEEEVKANQANEALIEELRNRVAKLTERESTTEAY